MEPRLSYPKVSPENYKGLLAWYQGVKKSDIDPTIRELVLIRASQINGCAFCLDMHTHDALKQGESARRLHTLAAWRESSAFTDREKAALAWAEAVTLLASTHITDEIYGAARGHFSEKEIVDLTMLIAGINAWNRLGVAFQSQPPETWV